MLTSPLPPFSLLITPAQYFLIISQQTLILPPLTVKQAGVPPAPPPHPSCFCFSSSALNLRDNTIGMENEGEEEKPRERSGDSDSNIAIDGKNNRIYTAATAPPVLCRCSAAKVGYPLYIYIHACVCKYDMYIHLSMVRKVPFPSTKKKEKQGKSGKYYFYYYRFYHKVLYCSVILGLSLAIYSEERNRRGNLVLISKKV